MREARLNHTIASKPDIPKPSTSDSPCTPTDNPQTWNIAIARRCLSPCRRRRESLLALMHLGERFMFVVGTGECCVMGVRGNN